MDDRYQLPSDARQRVSLFLAAKISPEIRATIFYPVSTDASSSRSKPVLYAIRFDLRRSFLSFVSAFQSIREKFPNLREGERGRTERVGWRILFRRTYTALSFSVLPFIYEYPRIDPPILFTPSRYYVVLETKYEDINRSRNRVERFVSVSVLSSLISFRSVTRSKRAKGMEKRFALR